MLEFMSLVVGRSLRSTAPEPRPRQGLIVVSRDLHSSVGNYRWHRGRDRAGWIDQIEPWLIGHLTLRSAELYRRNHLESVHDHDL